MPGNSGTLSSRVARLEAQFHGFRADILNWRLEHLRYHTNEESRWGLVKLMRDHPFRTLVAGMAAGSLLMAGLTGGQLWSLVAGWVR